MAPLAKCCCCITLRKGTFVFAMISIMFSIIGIALQSIALNNWEAHMKSLREGVLFGVHLGQNATKTLYLQNYKPFVVYDLAFTTLTLISASLAIYAVIKESPYFLIPYITVVFTDCLQSSVISLILYIIGIQWTFIVDAFITWFIGLYVGLIIVSYCIDLFHEKKLSVVDNDDDEKGTE